MENMNGESRTSRHDNGALPSKHGRLEGNGSSDVTMKKIAKLQELQENMIRQMDEQFKEIVGHMVEGIDNVDHVNHFHYDNAKYSNRAKSSKDGKLSDKIFLARESLLTDLFQIKHFYTIYNIFIAILIILFLNTAVYDIVSTGTLNLGLSLIQWNFGKFHIFFLMWILMMIGTVGVYCSMHFWAHYRKEYYGKSASRKAWDYGWLGLYIIYQVIFGIWPVAQVLKYNLPPASSMALLMEQVRLIMKSHAFVRSNIPRALTYKPHSEQDEKKLIPEFGHFLYFLFVPTLVYRDSYPRTHKISWHKVIWHFLEVVGVIFYVSFIFERFLVPLFNQYGVKHFGPEHLVVSIFGSMMPATLAFLCAFFGLLHSWMNAFAEMTRFADRMFYKDWWNANSYAEYYRMWNLVVHDWLYTYIFKDYCLLIKSKSRLGPTLTVFIVSAIVHEYILMFVFRFFYPLLFVAFGGFSAALVFLTGSSSKRGNLFMWLTLCLGTGVLTAAYSMEWYARINCPQVLDTVTDFFVPRSWFCNAVKQ
ncbi:hypothetical protein R5R35_003595 [Gryllus longicercus]|uniref:O-acyltransferase n=1 Tax=Gryllus longicercus TaxID=2509291 RepID=A0AAN9VGB4_9ORTH